MKPMRQSTSFFMVVLFTLSIVSPLFSNTVSAAQAPKIHRFSNIYEPSGVIFHPSGDILIVVDREQTPVYITRFSANADIDKITLDQPTLLPLASPADDLEGAALGKDGMVFLITSHSASKKGKIKKKRQQLIVLKIVDGKIVYEQFSDTLPAALKRQAINEKQFSKPDIDTLNIEGLTFDKDKNHLLVGLRAPLKKGKSILLVVENPYEIFSKNISPKFSTQLIELDMEGGGIRAIAYDHTLQTYLIANEIENDKGKLRPKLWAWDGNPAHQPKMVRLPKMKGVKNIEGITPVMINSRNFLLLVCDDGEKEKRKGAHYILLDYPPLKESISSR